MTRKTRKCSVLMLASALGLSLLAAGCGGGSTTDKAAFCHDNAMLNAKAQKITSVATAVSIFQANLSTIDDFGKKAPTDIKADAKKLVDAAHSVVASGNVKAFSDSATAAAGKRVDSYCGKSAPVTTTT
jgi:hypothetical protein